MGPGAALRPTRPPPVQELDPLLLDLEAALAPGDFKLRRRRRSSPDGHESGHEGGVGNASLEDDGNSGLEIDGSSQMEEDGDPGLRPGGVHGRGGQRTLLRIRGEMQNFSDREIVNQSIQIQFLYLKSGPTTREGFGGDDAACNLAPL